MASAAAAFCLTTVLRSGNVHAGEGKAEAAAAECDMAPLDYGRSFICNTASFNSVRFWIESRTRIWDTQSSHCVDYYQCGSCKSEHTFAPSQLFQEDNYDFLPILGGGNWLIFRRHAAVNERYRTTSPGNLWGEPELRLREVPRAIELETWEQIRDATAAATPIVTQTEIANQELGLRAVIECPCKTMNIGIDNRMYQVDTGPVAFPDLTRRYDPRIECLQLAFLAFNAAEFTDFILERPTIVTNDEGVALSQVYHYSQPFSLPARNRILALE